MNPGKKNNNNSTQTEQKLKRASFEGVPCERASTEGIWLSEHCTEGGMNSINHNHDIQ